MLSSLWKLSTEKGRKNEVMPLQLSKLSFEMKVIVSEILYGVDSYVILFFWENMLHVINIPDPMSKHLAKCP